MRIWSSKFCFYYIFSAGESDSEWSFIFCASWLEIYVAQKNKKKFGDLCELYLYVMSIDENYGDFIII